MPFEPEPEHGHRLKAAVTVAAILVVVAVGLTLSLGGNKSVALPTPEHVSIAGADHTVTAASQPTHQLPFYTGTSPAALTTCTVSLSNLHPLQGHTDELVNVATAPGAQVRLEADYSNTKSVHISQAGTGGDAPFALRIDHAQPGITVRVWAVATLGSEHLACVSAFAPVSAPTPHLALLSPISLFQPGTPLITAHPTGSSPVVVVVPPPTASPPTRTTQPPTTTTTGPPSTTPTTEPTTTPITDPSTTTTTMDPSTTTTTMDPSTTTTTMDPSTTTTTMDPSTTTTTTDPDVPPTTIPIPPIPPLPPFPFPILPPFPTFP
jgi:hypothetical protein